MPFCVVSSRLTLRDLFSSRVVVSVATRLEADPWAWVRLAEVAAIDVAAAAAVAAHADRHSERPPGDWLRSEAFLCQVGVPPVLMWLG